MEGDKKKVKFGWKRFFEPTPKRVKVLGNSMAASSLFVASLAMMGNFEKIAMGIAILGAMGKFISQFFSDESEQSDN